MNNKNALVLTSDERLIFALGNIIYQLNDFKFDFIDDIIIYLKSNNEILKQSLLKLSSKIKIIPFDDKDVIQYLNFDYKSNNFLKVYGFMVYARFLAFDLLKYYNNIIFLDIDMLILKDFSFILSDCPIAYKSRGCLNQYIECSKDYTVPNFGVVAINRSILRYIENPKLEAFATVNQFHNKQNIDELVLGYIVFKYNLPLKLLNNLKINDGPSNADSLNSAIVHGALPNKFWNNPVASFLFPKWHEYNTKWNQFCLDNNLNEFVFYDEITNKINPNKLFNAFFALDVYQQIWNCNSDLKIYIDLSDTIKIFINSISHSIHFEIKRYGYDFKLMLHDESPKRNDDTLKNFSLILKKLNLKSYVFPNRFEGFIITNINSINTVLNNFYEVIKESLIDYANLYKH